MHLLLPQADTCPPIPENTVVWGMGLPFLKRLLLPNVSIGHRSVRPPLFPPSRRTRIDLTMNGRTTSERTKPAQERASRQLSRLTSLYGGILLLFRSLAGWMDGRASRQGCCSPIIKGIHHVSMANYIFMNSPQFALVYHNKLPWTPRQAFKSRREREREKEEEKNEWLA